MRRTQHERPADQGPAAGLAEILRNRLQLAYGAPWHGIGIHTQALVETAGVGMRHSGEQADLIALSKSAVARARQVLNKDKGGAAHAMK